MVWLDQRVDGVDSQVGEHHRRRGGSAMAMNCATRSAGGGCGKLTGFERAILQASARSRQAGANAARAGRLAPGQLQDHAGVRHL